MGRGAWKNGWTSNATLTILLSIVGAVTIAAMVTVYVPHATYGMQLAWRNNGFGERNLAVTSVQRGSAAARAGLQPGDEIFAFASPADRLALALQSNLGTGWYLAVGQPASFSVENASGQRQVELRAAAVDTHRPKWFMEVRLITYLLSVIVAGLLVLFRPSVITWGFALFVILAEQPNILPLEFFGQRGSPLLFAAALFGFVPCVVAAGFLGLIAFAARFPSNRPQPGFAVIERAAWAYMGAVVLAFVEHYVAECYGWPSLSFAALVNWLYYVPALLAIALLLRTLLRSRGDARHRLVWAIAGPSLGSLFTVANVILVAMHVPYAYAAAFGFLSSLSPLAMVYAIVRHRVIELGEGLDERFAHAIPHSAPSQRKPGRRELVRRVALLFSAKVPLHGVYAQLAGLLAHFVDASSVLIAVGNKDTARLDYNYEDGSGARPDNVIVPPDSIVAQVLRTGQPVLFCREEDWPSSKLVSVGGRETQNSVSGIFVPVTFGGTIIGALSVQSLTPDAYDQDDVSMMETCALYLSARMYDEERAAHRRTGLVDRIAFDRAIAEQWKLSGRTEKPLSVVLIDVDLFASFNDAYGHVAGDTCLRQIGGIVEASAKHEGDLAARYGEEEFAVLLPGCDAPDAIEIAEQIRTAVRALEIEHQGSTLGAASVSAGVATYVPDAAHPPEIVMAAANAQLQRAKGEGRNRVAADGYGSKAQEARRRSTAEHHVAHDAGSFVGRRSDLARLEQLLAESAVVTVLGQEGAGKTRTALALVQRCGARYPDGVRFVDLRAVTTADAVAGTVASTLFPGLELEGADAAQLAELLRGKELLLVLDNSTLVADACASLTKSLIARAPGTRVLCTTSRPLRLAEEKTYEIGELSADEARELFADRAGDKIDGAFERAGGMPLVVELAAAAPERLPEAPEDVQAMVEWSCDRLSAPYKAVAYRLGIFPGDFGEAAAASVCAGGDVSSDDAGAALDALVRRALAICTERDGERRYSLPPAVRQHARAALAASGEMPAVKKRFVEYFGAFAGRATSRKTELPYEAWLRAQRREFDNYRAALRLAIDEVDDPTAASYVLRSLAGLILDLSPGSEFANELRRVVRPGDLPATVEAGLQMALSELRRFRAPAESLRSARRALELYASSGDELGAAYALWLSAAAQLRERGGIDAAFERALIDGVQAAKRARDWHLAVGLMRNLAYVQSDAGRHEEARKTLREAALVADPTDVVMLAALYGNTALEEFRDGKIDTAIAMWRQAAALVEVVRPAYAALCFVNAGLGELKRGDLMAARIALRKGLATLRATGHAFGIALSFDHFARLAKAGASYERAARLAGFAQASFERGVSRPVTEQGLFYELTDELRRELGNAAYEREWNRGQWMTLDEAVSEAHAV
ncbi:MAG TPA: diguanylate cyclase [Candidatus Baltobacteraceae bacterium]|jgi:diguanylate cyclase (GGDEF)-like protein